MINIAICDDDLKFTGALETLILQEVNKNINDAEISVFENGNSLINSIQNGQNYSIIFLDIEMPYLDGISTARKIREFDRSVLLIYVSSYDNYLKELFEVEPFRFLSKPLDIDKFRLYFKEACIRILDDETCFQFTFNKEFRKVFLKDIVYFESKNRVITIYLQDGSSDYFYGKLNSLEKELSSKGTTFLRIHQSFLVNYRYISKINFYYAVVNYSGKTTELKISEDRQASVRRKICDISSIKKDGEKL